MYRCGDCIPFWISPNILTIIGFRATALNLYLTHYWDTQSIWKYVTVSLLILVQFLFDALDGVQGRKWLQDSRDVYVSTQLFDHGFDSVTAIFTTLICIHIFEIERICSIYVSYCWIICLFVTFTAETLRYKIHHRMTFELHNNPTELTLLIAMMVIIKEMVSGKVVDWLIWLIVHWIIFIEFVTSFYEMATNSIKDSLSATAKMEIISVFNFVIWVTIGMYVACDACAVSCVWWYIALAVGQYHAMNLNLIVYEIIGRDCGLYNLSL